MSDTLAGLLQIGALVAALAICYRPLGGYMARVFTSERDLGVERVIYRLVGVDSKADQRWSVYAASVLAFSLRQRRRSSTRCRGCSPTCRCLWASPASIRPWRSTRRRPS